MAEDKKMTKLPATRSNGNVLPESEKKFGSLQMEQIKFQDHWAVWESYKHDNRDKSDQNSSFVSNNYELFVFNTMEGLAKIWRTQIGTPSQLFSINGRIVKLKESSTWRQTEAVCLFKKDIMPAWEDKMNIDGGEFQGVIDAYDIKPEAIDRIFRDFVIAFLADNYPFSAETNGVRIVDKSRGKIKIRFEIWVTFKSDQKKINQMGDFLENIFERNGYPTKLDFKTHSH